MSSDNGTTNTPPPQDPPQPQPKKGGFGAFSQQYRDRWAADHPNAKPAKPGADPAAPPTSPMSDTSAPEPEATP